MPNTNTQFSEGDLVFAKLKGYRPWPAKITEIIKNGNKTIKFNVTFFGDNQTSQVNESSLYPYQENIHIYGVMLPDNFKNKIFNDALKSADAAFKADSHTHISNQDVCSNMFTQTEVPDVINLSDQDSVPSQQDKIEDIQIKLQNAQDADLETSLTLAAEVGTVLLAENSKLKHDLHEAILKNSQLAKHISETASMSEARYQVQIEELECEKEALLNRIANLTDIVQEVENQLIKEKQLRNELERIFEDQDREREKTIGNYEKEISHLLEQQNKITGNSEINYKGNTFKDSETQTLGTEASILNSPTLVFCQLAELKIRQDKIEHQMTEMQKYLHTNDDTLMKTPKDSSAKMIQSIGRKSISNANNSLLSKNIRHIRKNHFSVSLQVAKSKALLKGTGNSKQLSHETVELKGYSTDPLNSSSSLTLPLKDWKPPISATKLKEGQTYDEFVEEFMNGLLLVQPPAVTKNNNSGKILVKPDIHKCADGSEVAPLHCLKRSRQYTGTKKSQIEDLDAIYADTALGSYKQKSPQTNNILKDHFLGDRGGVVKPHRTRTVVNSKLRQQIK